MRCFSGLPYLFAPFPQDEAPKQPGASGADAGAGASAQTRRRRRARRRRTLEELRALLAQEDRREKEDERRRTELGYTAREAEDKLQEVRWVFQFVMIFLCFKCHFFCRSRLTAMDKRIKDCRHVSISSNFEFC